MQDQTPEQIAQHYRALGDSVWLINSIIAGTALMRETAQERKETVDRNVGHLMLMRSKDFWTSEDMTSVDAAILAGQTYVGQN